MDAERAALDGRLRFDAAYTGTSRSAFNAGNADYLKMGGYATFGASFGLEHAPGAATWPSTTCWTAPAAPPLRATPPDPIDYFGTAPRTVRLTLERRFDRRSPIFYANR
jgi:iron complex outermembrane receptor protein